MITLTILLVLGFLFLMFLGIFGTIAGSILLILGDVLIPIILIIVIIKLISKKKKTKKKNETMIELEIKK